MDRLDKAYFAAKADEQRLLSILHKRRCKRRGTLMTTEIPASQVTRRKQYEQRANRAKDCPHLDKILSKISFPLIWERLTNTKPRPEQFLITTPRQMLKDLAIYGDLFLEPVSSPDGRLVAIQSLEPETIFRIETLQGKLLEFQQSKSGPDYESIANTTLVPYETLCEYKTIRFSPEKLLHFTINTVETSRFGAKYPYGTGVYDGRPDLLPYDEMEKLVAAAGKEMSEKIVECYAISYNKQLAKSVINKCLEPDANITQVKALLRRLLVNVETWGDPE